MVRLLYPAFAKGFTIATIRAMKIYTRTGDDGSTGLFGGVRVPKHDIRVNAYGTVDELNSILGLTIATPGDVEITELLRPHQSTLFDLGAILAADASRTENLPMLAEALVSQLEEQIDNYTAELPELRNFILPGGSSQAAWLHFARTVCRRAERELTLAMTELPALTERYMPGLKYLNRLSDWLFVLARLSNQRAGEQDIEWKSKRT
jgi:cob(I)alamin adenosyltransferase